MVKYIIYAEKLWHKPTWDALIKVVEKKGRSCYLFLMPPQYHYQQSMLGFRGTKEELNYILKKRYGILKRNQKKYGYGIGLRLQFGLNPEQLSEDEKMVGVKYTYNWINNIFRERLSNGKMYEVTNISFGGYKYDDFIKEVCHKNVLRIVDDEVKAITFKDYDLPLNKFKMFGKLVSTLNRIFWRFIKLLLFRGKPKWSARKNKQKY